MIRDTMVRHSRTRVRSYTPIADYLRAKLTRAATRLEALFTRWQAGWRPQPRSRTKSAPRPASVRTTPHLPTRKGWYVDALGGEQAQDSQTYTAGLEEYFHNPVLQQFVQDVPQAGRLLRPVAQMFHTNIPPALERPKNDHPKRVCKPRVKRPAPPPPQPPQYATVQDSFIPTHEQIARPGRSSPFLTNMFGR